MHEWLARSGGSEHVVEQLCAAFPDADLQVLWNDAPDHFPNARETWLCRTPLRHHKALALPFLPATWRHLKAEKRPNWILASSHLFAHHAHLADFPDVPKYAYIHTPARYIWEPNLDYRGSNPLVRAASCVFKPLDRHRAQEPAKMAANSEFTRQRIQRVWDRDADVIYPPVDVERIIAGGDWRNHLTGEGLAQLEALPSEFLLGASRFVPYKRLDLVIDVGNATDVPVVLAGRGPDYDRLAAKAARASVPVCFVDRPSDALLFALYQRCLVFVFPAIEDFGIMPVEAMAAGAAVIVPEIGGERESVEILHGGVASPMATVADMRCAVATAAAIHRTKLSERVRGFDSAVFRRRIAEWLPVI